jgi:hypothetical protein
MTRNFSEDFVAVQDLQTHVGDASNCSGARGRYPESSFSEVLRLRSLDHALDMSHSDRMPGSLQ